MALPMLTPRHRLDEVVEQSTVYVARPWWVPNPWFPTDPHTPDAPTGNMLPTGGSISCLAHDAVGGAESLALYEMAGLDETAPHIGYSDQEEYRDKLIGIGHDGRHVLCDHAPPIDFQESCVWVNDPSLISDLNDKANLPSLVSSAACPSRSFVPVNELKKLYRASVPLPSVLKASTALGSGAGVDVRICRNREELREAIGFFGSKSEFLNGVVLERFEVFKATWCALIAIRDDGWVYWGNAQQVCTQEGKYEGNWKGSAFEMPEHALDVVLHVAEQGKERGFRGLAGIDLGQTEDGRIVVFDLNFRVNGCTPQVLMHDAACERIGADVSRIRRFRFGRPLADVIADVKPVVQNGTLVPISSFDSALDPQGAGITSIAAMLVGASQDDVHRLEQQLEALE